MIVDIPDDLYNFIKSMGLEMETQDRRMTADPYFYQIFEKVRFYGLDPAYADQYVWVHKQDFENSVEPDDLPEDFNEDDYEKAYYVEREVFKNCFFTEKSIKEHINKNRHHYESNVNNYIDHAFRNPEMENVIKLIKLISKQ
jgi:hypothetical protein